MTPQQKEMLLNALRANHQWHQDNDDYGGYSESTLEEMNVAAIKDLEAMPTTEK